ncbi:MAG: two-component system response regulator [Oscillospiraceae bacterium]|nr:two-component system response regulator [Oscillospiraceae bacterium]
MKDVRIVIVDDSAFSVAFIRNILESNGCEVVGSAGTLEEVKEVVTAQRPNLVTMDMTLPGTDGLECTRAVHEIDKNIKVIVISSMMDDEIVNEAKKNKVYAYLQKPFESDDLMATIHRVMATEELYEFLQQEYASIFKECLIDGLNKMTKTLLTFKDEYSTSKECASNGITVIIGISGKFSGRMLIDLSEETASSLATAVFRREPKNRDEVAAALGEFANIIAGNACSILNRKNKALGLRLAPPSVLSGENVTISACDFNTVTAIGETTFGELLLNVGFKGGDDEWM